ncbi:MAG: NAD-dependent epimerase/dehydratase family protein [Magnetospirillum sp. WYHS-4]
MSRVLVTGGAGFIGHALCPALQAAGLDVAVATRHPRDAEKLRGVDVRSIPGVGLGTDWSAALRDVDAVIHLAARVHVMRDNAADPLSEFRRVNTEGTQRLVQDAIALGVARFVYVSTIKVNGEATAPGRAFRADDEPAPIDPYAVSKLEAETIFRDLAAQGGMDAVVVRPPLVYGPHVKGNFLTLLESCDRNPWLPLGAVRNARSLISAGNLADLLVRCLLKPDAAGHVFLARDGEDLSTPELIRRTARALGRKAHLLPVPAGFLRLAGALTGRADSIARLTESLVIDDTETRAVLDWTPPFSVDEGLGQTAEWFHRRHLR